MMRTLALRLWKDQDGQDLTEYALILVLIALAAITSIRQLSIVIQAYFVAIAAALDLVTATS